jgi:hypothetical protein
LGGRGGRWDVGMDIKCFFAGLGHWNLRHSSWGVVQNGCNFVSYIPLELLMYFLENQDVACRAMITFS